MKNKNGRLLFLKYENQQTEKILCFLIVSQNPTISYTEEKLPHEYIPLSLTTAYEFAICSCNFYFLVCEEVRDLILLLFGSGPELFSSYV